MKFNIERLLNILKVLHKVEDMDVVKCVIESLIDELEEHLEQIRTKEK